MRYEGYRYVREYRSPRFGSRWALWEQQGGRMRRVGTAQTEAEYRAFLYAPKSIDAHIAHCLGPDNKPRRA